MLTGLIQAEARQRFIDYCNQHLNKGYIRLGAGRKRVNDQDSIEVFRLAIGNRDFPFRAHIDFSPIFDVSLCIRRPKLIVSFRKGKNYGNIGSLKMTLVWATKIRLALRG